MDGDIIVTEDQYNMILKRIEKLEGEVDGIKKAIDKTYAIRKDIDACDREEERKKGLHILSNKLLRIR